MIEFEGSRFRGDIVPALAEVVDLGIIRIIDMVFVTKDESGSVRGLELDALDDDEAEAVAPVTDDVMGLLSEEDVRRVGAALTRGSSAAMVVFEHSWAARLQQAIRDANGRLVAMERIPVDVVEQAAAAARS